MHLFKYIIAIIILCGIPDYILTKLFWKWHNRTLITLQYLSWFVFYTLLAFAMIARYYTVSFVPLMIFSFVGAMIYVPKWLFFPFALYKKIGLAFVSATCGALFVLFGAFIGRTRIITRKVDIWSNNIPEQFEGYRIVQISDIHLGSINRTEDWINALPDSINKHNPDLLLFTGDLVNMYAKETYGWDPMFLRMDAKDAKLAIRGNHDYSAYLNRGAIKADSLTNILNVTAAFERFGFTLLSDSVAIIRKGKDSIVVYGTENIGHPPFPQIGSISKTISYYPDAKCKIMMTHDPSAWEERIIDSTDVMLTLSGHTHAMQMGIDRWGIHLSPSMLISKHWDGLYQIEEQLLFINHGMSYVGYPMRFGMYPEITLFELHHSENSKISYKIINEL